MIIKPSKTPRSAVAILPPESLWEPINAIRKRYDTQIIRWMPHINLLFPFVYPEALPEQEPILRGALSAVAPFSVTLGTFSHFDHSGGRSTLWIMAEPKAPLVALQTALQAAYPKLNDLSRPPDGYTPHLTVGKTRTHLQAHRIAPALEREWQPLRFDVTAVAVLARERPGPFEVDRMIPLGG